MTLSDGDIRGEIAAGRLILDGIDACIGPACYELRMGQVYYDLTESDRPIDVKQGLAVLIKPGHRVVLITLERLLVPDNIIARVVSKGSLFSVGLSPVCTYADPGFAGNLGIVTQNISDKYVEIPVGEPIAKIDFTRLSQRVERPYRGQHGFQTQIWPIKHHLQKTYREVSGDARVESERDEAYKLLPKVTADFLLGVQRRQRWFDVALFGAVFMNAAFWAANGTGYMETVTAIFSNLVTTALVGLGSLIVGWRSRK